MGNAGVEYAGSVVAVTRSEIQWSAERVGGAARKDEDVCQAECEAVKIGN